MSEPVREAGPDELAGWDARDGRRAGRRRPAVACLGGPPGAQRAGRPHHLVLADGSAVLVPGAAVAAHRRRAALRAARPGRGRRSRGARRAERLAAVAAWARASRPATPSLADPEIPAATRLPGARSRRAASARSRRSARRATGSRVPIPAGRRRRRAPGRDREDDPPALPRRRAEGRPRRPLRRAGRPRPDARARGTALRRSRGRGAGRVRPVPRPARRDRRAARLRARARPRPRRLVARRARGRPPRLPRGARRADGRRSSRAAILYRHGGRLSYAPLGRSRRAPARPSGRDAPPAAGAPSSWPLREGRAELDLGGVDVAGARRSRCPGEPTYGLYEFKRSFGAGGWSWPAPRSGSCGRSGTRSAARPRALARRPRRGGRAAGRRGRGRARRDRARLAGGAAEAALRAALAPRSRRDAPLAGLIARLAAAGRLRTCCAGDGPAGRCRRGRPVPTGHRRRLAARRPGRPASSPCPGAHVDGHAFVARGGRGRRGGARRRARRARRVAAASSSWIASQLALAVAPAWWYGDPVRELGVIGITGTDGKTTTACLAVAALEAAGVRHGPRRARPRPRIGGPRADTRPT